MVANPFAARPPFAQGIEAGQATPAEGLAERLRIAWPERTLAEATPGQVSHVFDGDTLRAITPSGVVTVRLPGIDAPEICTSSGIPERGAVVARSVLASLVLGMPVMLVRPSAQPIDDRFGRQVAHVIRLPERLDTGLEMLRLGWAWPFWSARHDHAAAYRTAYNFARTLHVGLWSLPWSARDPMVAYFPDPHAPDDTAPAPTPSPLSPPSVHPVPSVPPIE